MEQIDNSKGCDKCQAFTPPFELYKGLKTEDRYYTDTGEEITRDVILVKRSKSYRDKPVAKFRRCPFCHTNINCQYEFWVVKLKDGFTTSRWIEKFHSYGDMVLPDDDPLEELFSETDRILEADEEQAIEALKKFKEDFKK